MSQGVYLFCLTPRHSFTGIAGAGMDEAHPLSAELFDDVVAIVSEVSLEDFCGPEARDKLADLAWVAPRALRHEDVIMTVMRQAPVLPVRFGSVFSSVAALASSLARHRDALSGFFLATAGQQEWTLAADADMPHARAQVLAARLAEAQEQLAGLSPGKRYLLEQSIKGVVDRDVAGWLKETAGTIALFCQDTSSAFHDMRLLPQELTGKGREMFFHTALLVPDCSLERLQGLAAEWNASHEPEGLHLALAGPWPPYHFTPVLDTQG